MNINISEELFDAIMEDLYTAQGARMNDDSVHMRDVSTDTISLFEEAYEDGTRECIVEAYKRYHEGEDPSWSTGNCGSITVGYGKLDDYGYWEFPLIVDEDTNYIMSWSDYTK